MNPVSQRGDRTRDRLLDAVESRVMKNGFAGLSHRAIARDAGVHGALVHYHFGTVDRLVEEAVARRATRLARAQLAAIARLSALPRYSLADVVRALWSPYEAIEREPGSGWSHYLCFVARLASTPNGRTVLRRHFAEVEAAAHESIRRLHPGADDAEIAEGLAHVHAVIDRRIRATHCPPEASHAVAARHARLVEFAAGGLERMLIPRPAIANGP